MKVEVLREAGYEEAMLGLSLSYNQPADEMPRVATKLYRLDDSDSKFLRFITVWLDIVAPRYWWCQMDTYSVGKAQQSESTMHTILERMLTPDDFADGWMDEVILHRLNVAIEEKAFHLVKQALPEGFLQRRIVVTNYQTLRRIIRQRCTHRLPEWRQFIAQLLDQLEHQEFVEDLKPAEVYP